MSRVGKVMLAAGVLAIFAGGMKGDTNNSAFFRRQLSSGQESASAANAKLDRELEMAILEYAKNRAAMDSLLAEIARLKGDGARRSQELANSMRSRLRSPDFEFNSAALCTFVRQSISFWKSEIVSAGLDGTLAEGCYGAKLVSELERQRLLQRDSVGAKADGIKLFSKLGRIKQDFDSAYSSLCGEGDSISSKITASALAFRCAMEKNKFAYRENYYGDKLFSEALENDSVSCYTSGYMYVQFSQAKGLPIVGVHIPGMQHFVAAAEINGQITHYIETTEFLSSSSGMELDSNMASLSDYFLNSSRIPGAFDRIFTTQRAGWRFWPKECRRKAFMEWKNGLNAQSQSALDSLAVDERVLVTDKAGAEMFILRLGKNTYSVSNAVQPYSSNEKIEFDALLGKYNLLKEFAGVHPASEWEANNGCPEMGIERSVSDLTLLSFRILSLSVELDKLNKAVENP